MADGAPIDYSLLLSDSTIELIGLANTRPSSRPSPQISSSGSRISWHPKLTLYRLLVILSTVGLAAAKTATSYLNLTFASITLEWILGVVVFLFFHLLGAYEETNNRYLTWLFNVDYLEYFWAFLEKLTCFRRPYYVSDEIDTRQQTMEIDPLVTGYRIIVTVLVVGVGMTKSGLLYGQEPMEATTIECVFGVGIVTGLYWLGLYEASSTKTYPKLFHVDYSDGLSYITGTVMRVFLGLFIILFSLLFFGTLSYGFYHLAALIIPFKMSQAEEIKLGTMRDIVIKTILGGLMIYAFTIFFIGFFGILLLIGWVTYFVFQGFIFLFVKVFEALKKFTIDVELVDAPV